MIEKIQLKEEPYIDSWTHEAFNEAGGGDYISRQELGALGQVFRSAESCDIFESLTGVHIGGKADMKQLFESAVKGKIDLSEVLKSPRLKKYVERKSPYALD